MTDAAKRLVKALREDAEWAHDHEWDTPITLGDHLEAAANRIEKLFADCDTWQRRAEAAERDMMELMKDSSDGCDYCKNHVGCTCSWDDCKPEWRGPCAENGETANDP